MKISLNEALVILKNKGWDITAPKYCNSPIHAYFFYKTDLDTINSLEFVAIQGSYNYDDEVVIRETENINDPSIDSNTVTIDSTEYPSIDSKTVTIDSTEYKDELLSMSLVNKAIELIEKHKSSKIQLSFDYYIGIYEEEIADEPVVVTIDDYIGYDLMAYWHEETGSSVGVRLSSKYCKFNIIE